MAKTVDQMTIEAQAPGSLADTPTLNAQEAGNDLL